MVPYDFDSGDRGSSTFHIIGGNDMDALRREDFNGDHYRTFNKGISASVLIMIRLEEGRRFCSGFIYELNEAQAKIITNHHCFAVQDDATNMATYEVIGGVCDVTTVFFNATLGLEHKIEAARCTGDSLRTEHRADIAAFTVEPLSMDGTFPEEITSIPITTSSEVGFNEPAYIVHYPLDAGDAIISYHGHEMDGNLRGELPATIITQDNCKIVGEYMDVSEWESNPVLAMSFKHTCDLSKGSSGSPLISQVSHEVIGLNWGGVKTMRKSSGEEQQVEVSNASIKPDCIHSFLKDPSNLESCISDPLFAMSLSQKGRANRNEGVEFDDWAGGLGCSSKANAMESLQPTESLQSTGSLQPTPPLARHHDLMVWMLVLLSPFFLTVTHFLRQPRFS